MTIPKWARDYVGLRFKPHGRDREGVDCWGLARLILAERTGISLPDYSTVYTDCHDGHAIEAAQEAAKGQWLRIGPGGERELDLVQIHRVWRNGDGAFVNAPIHLGVVVTPGVLIHVDRHCDAALSYYRRDPVMARALGNFWRYDGAACPS